MRVPNDLQLLSSDADIDLILGGHDHHYEVRQVWLLLMNTVFLSEINFRFIFWCRTVLRHSTQCPGFE